MEPTGQREALPDDKLREIRERRSRITLAYPFARTYRVVSVIPKMHDVGCRFGLAEAWLPENTIRIQRAAATKRAGAMLRADGWSLNSPASL